MIEFIVIATSYKVLLLKLRITFVPFLTACFAFTDRCNNPVTQHESKNQTFFHSYERTSCVDYTTGSLKKSLCVCFDTVLHDDNFKEMFLLRETH